MQDISALLLLTSLVCLIIGVIRPQTFQKIFKENTNRKTVSLTFLGVMILSFILFGISSDTKEKNTAVDKSNTNNPLTRQDSIRLIVIKAIGETNNMGKQSIKSIDVISAGDHNAVHIKFNPSENITNSLTRTTIESDMSKIYISLHESSIQLDKIVLSAYYTLVDKYGKETDGMVYETELEKSEADKINWEADESSLRISIIPKVWTVNFMHNSLE